MAKKAFGEIISALRRDKSVTQEELGRAAGVSTQAVSKWENGGVPDVELLPVIADFFGVSVDRLFDREPGTQSLRENVVNYFTALPQGEKAEKAFEYCWTLQGGLVGIGDFSNDENFNLRHIREKFSVIYSHILKNEYTALMCLGDDTPYFTFFPDTKTRAEKLFEDIDYTEFFTELSDRDFFNAFILLHRHNKPFTENLLVRELGVAPEKVRSVIEFLKKYRLLEISEIELDDEIKTVFTPKPNPAVVPFLTFARELIDRPRSFTLFNGGRKTPYIAT